MSVEFITTINFLDKSVEIKELLVSDFKIVLKALIEAETNPKVLVSIVHDILLNKTSLTESELVDLNFIEVLHLLFIVRLHSGTNTVMLTVDNKGTTTNLHINLDKLNDKLYKIINDNKDVKCTNGDFVITHGVPSIIEICDENDLYFSCIKEVAYKNNFSINLRNTSKTIKADIIKRIPLSIYRQILTTIRDNTNNIQKIDLLDTYKIKDLCLYLKFDVQHIISIIRLLFYENLLNLYQNIFALCKYTNLTPEYIENMSIGELGLYIKMLEVSLEQNNKASPPPQLQGNG